MCGLYGKTVDNLRVSEPNFMRELRESDRLTVEVRDWQLSDNLKCDYGFGVREVLDNYGLAGLVSN